MNTQNANDNIAVVRRLYEARGNPEMIQRTFPETKVVKTLNTVNCEVMVNPALAPGDHDIFICGNDAGAKARVAELLKQQFGWRSVTDLGDISAARATEQMMPIWLRLYGTLGTPHFNFRVVTASKWQSL